VRLPVAVLAKKKRQPLKVGVHEIHPCRYRYFAVAGASAAGVRGGAFFS
jgi:hypothetical protein